MSLFGVLLISDNQGVRRKISANYEKSLRVQDDFYLISTNQQAKTVAETVGIYSAPEEDTLGIVFRINGSYAGFAPGVVWDWIEEQTKTS